MRNNIVSIIMSVYGYESYVRESINSILCQTFKDFEFIIIDDGCKYDLYDIIKSYDDNRIICIKNKNNIGLTKSLNKGIDVAKGKYIARHDAGNISLFNRVETQYNYLEEKNDYFLIGASAILIDGRGNEICKIIANNDFNYIRNNLPKSNLINHSSIMFRNDGNSFYRSKFKYSQDYDFYLRLLSERKKISNIAMVLLKERFTKDSISFSKAGRQDYFARKAREFYFQRLKTGKDNYSSFDASEKSNSDGNKKSVLKNRPIDDHLYYIKNKIRFLIFSKRFVAARKDLKEELGKKFDIKLFLYLILSYMPFTVRILGKIRKIDFR